MSTPGRDTPNGHTPDQRAFALMESANALIAEGNWRQAAADLEQAASLHARARRDYDEARCLQFAASLLRMGGDLDRATDLIRRAAEVAPDDLPLAVSIRAEQAEIALASESYAAAIQAETDALRYADEAGLRAEGRSALLRRRGLAYVAEGQLEQSAADYDQAYDLLAAQGEPNAAFVRVEQAQALVSYGHTVEAGRVLDALEASGAREYGPHLLAELLVLRARLARTAGQAALAERYAGDARQAALEAIAPVSYLATAVELAEALDMQGDRKGAYGALATAWATLGDVLDGETARSWVEPLLLGFRMRWGERLFAEARASYEAERRAQRAGEARTNMKGA